MCQPSFVCHLFFCLFPTVVLHSFPTKKYLNKNGFNTNILFHTRYLYSYIIYNIKKLYIDTPDASFKKQRLYIHTTQNIQFSYNI